MSDPFARLCSDPFARYLLAFARFRSRYDLVTVDAPPVLAVTDAAVIGAVVGNPLTFMMLKSGYHPMEEINQAVERISRQHGKVSGFTLNAYQARKAKAYQGYSQYQYAYSQST